MIISQIGGNKMNKFMRIAGIAAVLVASLALVVVVTGAFAQGPSAPDPTDGTGQMVRGNGAGAGMGVMAVDEADMHAAIAEALGMTLEDFEAALVEGKTPFTLALELGIDFADIQAAMSELHAEALEQATADGLITQERADFMLGRQAGHSNGVDGPTPGAGSMMHGAGNMAQGSANHGGSGGECLYETP
jgi:hypothetical protein